MNMTPSQYFRMSAAIKSPDQKNSPQRASGHKFEHICHAHTNAFKPTQSFHQIIFSLRTPTEFCLFQDHGWFWGRQVVSKVRYHASSGILRWEPCVRSWAIYTICRDRNMNRSPLLFCRRKAKVNWCTNRLIKKYYFNEEMLVFSCFAMSGQQNELEYPW